MAMPIVFQVVGAVTSPWVPLSYYSDTPMNVSVALEGVSGSISCTVNYTYDDPNNLLNGVTTPLAFHSLTPTALGGGSPGTPATTTVDGTFTFPIAALQVVNTGTGTVRVRILQAGIG